MLVYVAVAGKPGLEIVDRRREHDRRRLHHRRRFDVSRLAAFEQPRDVIGLVDSHAFEWKNREAGAISSMVGRKKALRSLE